MTQETKPKDCCYGVRPLSDCQCEKDRLATLAATPAELQPRAISQLENCAWKQAGIVSGYWIKDRPDKEFVSVRNGDLRILNEATHAIVAATPAVGGKARDELTKMAAECHRAKWQFDLSEDFQPSKSAARALILQAFHELHRIGDLAMKARDALAPPASPLRGREWQSIKTAPKDGSTIEVRYVSDDPRCVRWSQSRSGTGWHLTDAFSGTIIEFEPTEWRSASPPEQPAAPRCDRCGSSSDVFMMCAGCQSPLSGPIAQRTSAQDGKIVSTFVHDIGVLARALLAAVTPEQPAADREETEIELLAYRLAGAELDYRIAYEKCGGDSINTGRAWDKMRLAGDAIRKYEPPDQDSA